MVDERGFKGAGIMNPGIGGFFNECMHKLSPLSMQELTRQGSRIARADSQRHSVKVGGWGSE
jgi:hypothetical protein